MSENKTLVAYATRGGTTEDYAKAISSVLTDEFNMQADLVNLKKSRNPDLTQYKNIIVGAGIKMFKMHKEGAEFLEKRNFGGKNVGIFLSMRFARARRGDQVRRRHPSEARANRILPFTVELLLNC